MKKHKELEAATSSNKDMKKKVTELIAENTALLNEVEMIQK